MSEDSTGRTIRFTLDLEHPPELSVEEHETLDRLSHQRDRDIDFGDIPRQTNIAGWYVPGWADCRGDLLTIACWSWSRM